MVHCANQNKKVWVIENEKWESNDALSEGVASLISDLDENLDGENGTPFFQNMHAAVQNADALFCFRGESQDMHDLFRWGCDIE